MSFVYEIIMQHSVTFVTTVLVTVCKWLTFLSRTPFSCCTFSVVEPVSCTRDWNNSIYFYNYNKVWSNTGQSTPTLTKYSTCYTCQPYKVYPI